MMKSEAVASVSKQSHAHPFADAFVLGQGYNGLDVFLRQLGHRHTVILAAYVIGQDDSGEHREAVARVERAVIVVVVDARQLLMREFVSWLVVAKRIWVVVCFKDV